jgi:hypothetical protein
MKRLKFKRKEYPLTDIAYMAGKLMEKEVYILETLVLIHEQEHQIIKQT